MLIYEVLKKDHQKLRKIMEAIVRTPLKDPTGDVEKRRNFLRAMKRTLFSHWRAEEAIFYKSLSHDPQTRQLAMDALETQRQAERKLLELEDLDFANEDWMQKFQNLKEVLEQHFLQEEQELFKSARKILTREKAEVMGSEFRDLRTEVSEELRI